MQYMNPNPKHPIMIKLNLSTALLFFIVFTVKGQDSSCFNFNAAETPGWIDNSSCLILSDTIGAEIVEINVLDADSGTIRLVPTANFPDKYLCSVNDIAIKDKYRFDKRIKRFRPERVKDTGNNNKKMLAVEFEFSRKFIIMDLTGIVALRYLIPNRETIYFSEK